MPFLQAPDDRLQPDPRERHQGQPLREQDEVVQHGVVDRVAREHVAELVPDDEPDLLGSISSTMPLYSTMNGLSMPSAIALTTGSG